jgi:hypothetical protein
MRAWLAALVWAGCGGEVAGADGVDADPDVGDEVAFGDPIDAAPNRPDPPTCEPCPTSPPPLGSKCTSLVFCEYETDASVFRTSCQANCLGSRWGPESIPDAAPDALPYCPTARPLMGSPCSAGPQQCPLGFTFHYTTSVICVAETYSCACGRWQLNQQCYVGFPPPC